MSFIETSKWDTMYTWIKPGDIKHIYLKKNLINKTYPALLESDKELLLDAMTLVLNTIYLKFNFHENPNKPDTLFWDQLIQNDLLDLRAILGIILPFINNDENDNKKHQLKQLSDLYLSKDNGGNYIYTNAQYNRCMRSYKNGTISYEFVPFKKIYFQQHLELLLMSIETTSNKLYVNWVDVIPIAMSDYATNKLYLDTVKKLETKYNRKNKVKLINNYLDPLPGLSVQDIYNTMANHLYHQIKNFKWIIYNIMSGDESITYIDFLESKFTLDSLWEGKLWSQLSILEIQKFTLQWNTFLKNENILDRTILNSIHIFFSKYHVNADDLIEKGLLIYSSQLENEEESGEEDIISESESIRAYNGMYKVPIHEIYLFFLNQLSAFSKTWYYYISKIKKQKNFGSFEINGGNTIYVTPKNVYNYCKSMIHYIDSDTAAYLEIPGYWTSLPPDLLEMVIIRLFDIDTSFLNSTDKRYNNWKDTNWFNISRILLKKVYKNLDNTGIDLHLIHENIHKIIKKNLASIIFESLVFHGILSEFKPEKNISNDILVKNSIGSDDANKMMDFRRKQMKKFIFTEEKAKKYSNDSYYFVTGKTYGELEPIRMKTFKPPLYEKKYFDFLVTEQDWTFTYAMNWVNQINFDHHYLNNRVIYVTGATGVGKSTQVPPLLIYAQKMLDYNFMGKIICTQPRIHPTVATCEYVSRSMGVPIRSYDPKYEKDLLTSNYYLQFKHQEEEHTMKTNSFLRIVTDGTLYEEMKTATFLTDTKPDTSSYDKQGNKLDWVVNYSARNKYDIVLVDEAHEHNANMDLILTLARDSLYINNSLKLVIVSATMDDDEPIYRRYYRRINDNRLYPLSAYIATQKLDRVNMDRRIHISPPGGTTRFLISEYYYSPKKSDQVNESNYLEYGIEETIKIANSTTSKNILLFMTGQEDIKKCVKRLNPKIPANMIALGYYSELSEETKTMIKEIHTTLPVYTRYKEDVFLEESDITRRVPAGTYTRAIIIATNVAEASVTFRNLGYVVDTGYAKRMIYDPIDGISKMKTLPISRSSSQQRKGRVGRVAPGSVYYIYSAEKLANNKTVYNIADVNAKNIILPLLKKNSQDYSVITDGNDINNIFKLRLLRDKLSKRYRNANYLYDIFNNPLPIIEIIKKNYLYVKNHSDPKQFYYYYGVDEMDDYNFRNDDEILMKGYTGYNDYILKDQECSFFIIHPDENVIQRDPYTGKMVGIKNSPSVSKSYYYYLLTWNDVKFDPKSMLDFNQKKIDFDSFQLLKYTLAMDEAKTQLEVVTITDDHNYQIINKNVTSNVVAGNIQHYYSELETYMSPLEHTTIKTTFYNWILELQRIVKIKILNDSNLLLWYAYVLVWELEDDVLALIFLSTMITDMKRLMGKHNKKPDAATFFRSWDTEKGDLYVIWQVWKIIKEMLNKYGFFSIVEINANTEMNFNINKNKFIHGEKIAPSEYTVFNKLYNSGKINVDDDFYNYLSSTTYDAKNDANLKKIYPYLQILADNYNLNYELLVDFIQNYFGALYLKNKSVWMEQYDLKKDENKNKNDIIEKIKRQLNFSSHIVDPNHQFTEWDKIYEAYIRVFSVNLIKDCGNKYLNVGKGFYLDPSFWSPYYKLEKTFLKGSPPYLLYHSTATKFSDIIPICLTPVKLEWVMQLNPLYYYFLFYRMNDSLHKMMTNDGVVEAINFIEKNKKYYDFNSLIAYLNQLDDYEITKIIRKELADIVKN